ncbi:probable E3 ubiquitin-protein ligase ATL45 [Lolium rigidum]|uniref:probable E3 ubiquitin-protein ligase ATL45 n=1 Tax=Lolium rigidum TaxID=89674 RepID=UPI001F5D8B41|nr:probable E3 ubiquitin-protein ligase ATL45 [Lolium rigidum]
MATNGSRAAATPPSVQRRIQATTICFSKEAAPAGEFAVRVVCYATRSTEFWRRGAERPHDVVLQKHAAGSTATTFLVTDLAVLRSTSACRGALRGMLAELQQIRSLRLAEDEWDAVVPGDVLPEIVGAARRGNGFTFCLLMEVHRRVIHDERALTMACKEKLATTAPGEKDDCAICFSGLHGLEGESAVDLPGCNHAFHRRCISKWFSKAATCPLCRGDVWFSALPELFKLFSTGEPA